MKKKKDDCIILQYNYLSVLLHKITSKSKSDFCCLNCLYSFRTENKHVSQEKLCKNQDFYGIAMPSEKDNILEFNQYMKSQNVIHYLC